VCEFLENNDSLPDLSNYYRQYIGVESNGKKYIYVNLFSRYICRGEYMPNIWGVLYTKEEGKFDYGHMVIDENAKEIVQYSFINKDNE